VGCYNKDVINKDQQTNLQQYNLTRDRERRCSRPLVRYGFFDLVSFAPTSAIEVIENEPLTYEETVHSNDSHK